MSDQRGNETSYLLKPNQLKVCSFQRVDTKKQLSETKSFAQFKISLYLCPVSKGVLASAG